MISELPEHATRLKINRCTVKVFTNELLLIEKGFRNRKIRNEWMERIIVKLEGVKSIYFQVSYREVAKKTYQIFSINQQEKNQHEKILLHTAITLLHPF